MEIVKSSTELIKSANDPIVFIEETHEYRRYKDIHSDNFIKYTSTTQVLHKYEQKFDKKYWSAHGAIKRYITDTYGENTWVKHKKWGRYNTLEDCKKFVKYSPDSELILQYLKELLMEWRDGNKHACDLGSKFHLFKEQKTASDGFSTIGGITRKYKYRPYIQPDFEEGVYTETLMYLDEFALSGKFDESIFFMKNGRMHFKLRDFKTNKKGIEMKAFRNQKMLYPLDNLPNCNYWIYSLQLSVYAFILESWGYKCDGLEIVWIDMVNGDEITIPIEYLRDEVLNMLLHHNHTIGLLTESQAVSLRERTEEKIEIFNL